MNWYKKSQTQEDFLSIGREQRGVAEEVMVRAQKTLGGGVMNFCIEHAGDLIHRMNDVNTFEYSGYPYVKEKVEKLLSVLSTRYGFAKEYWDNLKTNAEYNGEDLKEKKNRVNEALEDYIEAHLALKSYNRAHKLCKTIVVSIADLKVEQAVVALKELQSHLGSVEEWTRFAHEGLKTESSETDSQI